MIFASSSFSISVSSSTSSVSNSNAKPSCLQARSTASKKSQINLSAFSYLYGITSAVRRNRCWWSYTCVRAKPCALSNPNSRLPSTVQGEGVLQALRPRVALFHLDNAKPHTPSVHQPIQPAVIIQQALHFLIDHGEIYHRSIYIGSQLLRRWSRMKPAFLCQVLPKRPLANKETRQSNIGGPPHSKAGRWTSRLRHPTNATVTVRGVSGRRRATRRVPVLKTQNDLLGVRLANLTVRVGKSCFIDLPGNRAICVVTPQS